MFNSFAFGYSKNKYNLFTFIFNEYFVSLLWHCLVIVLDVNSDNA